MPTPQQRKQLRNALIDAFPEKSSLEQLLYFELGRNLNAITRNSDLQDIAFKLIQTAESQGWLLDLVGAACNSNPGNLCLQAIAQELLTEHLETASIILPNIPQEQSTQQQKILILAANAKDTNKLRLDEELREIEQGLQRAKLREQFEIKLTLAVRSRDIHRSILDFKPYIVHFSGHGAGKEGLVFENETGQAKLVDTEALAGLFELFADRVKCVVLNACFSEIQAKAIAQYVDYVIGMSQAIEDRDAIEFAVGFYDALGAGESIEFAYKLGCRLIRIAGIPESLTPKLITKKQLDLKLITSPPSSEQQDSNQRVFVYYSPLNHDLSPNFFNIVLWVDDNPNNNIFERHFLEASGISFVLVTSTEEALKKIDEKERNGEHFDAIISDMGRPPDQQAGYTLLNQLRSRRDQTPFVIYSGSRAREHVEESKRRGAIGCTNKPDELFKMVLFALGRRASR